MEYNNSILSQSPQPSVGRSGNAAPKNKRPKRGPNWLNGVTMALLVSIALLIGGLLFFMSMAKQNNEAGLVDANKFQAVFLDGGQVYFGKVKSINNESLVLDNVFYLRMNGQEQETQANQDVSLSKLGCELHGPQDQMIITKSNVSFWENLKDDGQVVKAINEFEKQNPNGQQCQAASGNNSQQSPQPSTTQQAPATNPNTNTQSNPETTAP